jgi:hypothetical protein
MAQKKQPSKMQTKTFRLLCEKCQNVIAVPVTQEHIDSAIGGIFKIVAVHQCSNEQIVLSLFFDTYLALRQKLVSKVTVTDMENGEALDPATQSPIKNLQVMKSLYKQFRKDIAPAIFAVITGQQVVFIGSKGKVHDAVNAMTIFAPHRNLVTNKFTTKISDGDIVGTTAEMADKYWDAVVIDLEKQAVKNGISNQFCVKLMQKLNRYKDAGNSYAFVNAEINRIMNYVKDYVSIESLQEAKDYLTTLTEEGVDEPILEVILPLGAQLNPQIAMFYRQQLYEQSIDKVANQPTFCWTFDKKQKTIDRLLLSSEKDNIHFKYLFKVSFTS